MTGKILYIASYKREVPFGHSKRLLFDTRCISNKAKDVNISILVSVAMLLTCSIFLASLNYLTR